MFEVCRIGREIVDERGDIRDAKRVLATIHEYRPDVILHLAAQPLVRPSYRAPRHTFEVNLMGTVNVLEAALHADFVRSVIVVTTDKCYRNVGWDWGYREIDPLGGNDPYSASKACAELAVAAFQARAFGENVGRVTPFPLASARAGNVIGGGDWGEARLVPDTIRAIVNGDPIVLRYPKATRPWQHVLEATSGYLVLGAQLAGEPDRLATAFNFGPANGSEVSVQSIVEQSLELWPSTSTTVRIEPDPTGGESVRLELDSTRARARLGWSSNWNVREALAATTAWYRAYHEERRDMYAFTVDQIQTFEHMARKRSQAWAGHA